MNFRKLRIKVISMINKIRFYVNAYKHCKYVKNQIKDGYYYEGSDEEYETVVVSYWKKLTGGKFIPKKYWYQYFGYKLQKFDPRIIPMDLFQKEIMPYLNEFAFQPTLENKIYFDYIMHDIKKPKIFIKYVNGFLMNGENEFIDFTELENIIKEQKELIIKPIDLEKGTGVKKLKISENYEESLNEIKRRMDNQEFIIQEFITQSPQISKFNPSSVNTIRVISLLINNRVEILSAILRVGATGLDVDNYDKGGDCRSIDKDGKLDGYLIHRGKISTLDRYGNPVEKVEIIGFDKVVKEIKKIHPRIPHLRWIGWDFAIDQNYEPVFIELNGFAGEDQAVCGPIFGDITEEFITELFENRHKKRFERADV